VIPANGHEGVCVRSGPKTDLTFDDSTPVLKSAEVIAICERIEALGPPALGESRLDHSEHFFRCLNNILGSIGGQVAESILHPDLPSLETPHDFSEALAFARIATITTPAVESLVQYAMTEAHSIIVQNIDVAHALVTELEKVGILSGEQVDVIIANTVAARAIAAEKVRRNEWSARISSAERFKLVIVDTNAADTSITMTGSPDISELISVDAKPSSTIANALAPCRERSNESDMRGACMRCGVGQGQLCLER
jgi:hypothetical protein